MTTVHSRYKGQVQESPAASTQESFTYNAARNGSESLRLRLEHEFHKEAARLSLPLGDARLLCMNSVRLEIAQ